MPINPTQATREYGALLDDMRKVMSDYLGVLHWLPRQETGPATTREGKAVLRVGPDFARAVQLRNVVPRTISELCNDVLERHEFQVQPDMTGSPSGHLTMTSQDGRGAVFNYFCKADLEYWVDLPMERVVQR